MARSTTLLLFLLLWVSILFLLFQELLLPVPYNQLDVQVTIDYARSQLDSPPLTAAQVSRPSTFCTLNSCRLCIVIRVNPSDPIEYLHTLLYSLRTQSSRTVSQDIFLLNSQNVSFKNFFSKKDLKLFKFLTSNKISNKKIVSGMDNTRYFFNISVLTFPDLSSRHDKYLAMDTYGYFMTEKARKYLVEKRSNNCEYVMFTNSDNTYHRDLILDTEDFMFQGKNVISWSFSSHHTPPPHHMSNLMVSGKLQRGSVDLGSAFVRFKAMVEANATFFYKEEKKKRLARRVKEKTKLFAADWYFFKKLVRKYHSTTTVSSIKVLMFHQ